ncbi:hypothetical protein ROG8370_00399 [Roseovarius gaetbuli]|uniref:Uncharacterized protein n=1 Tax=Roseovarius gaetbuli TaxID=1356575 RepID=A0A1X6YAH2_9RHOB|nr:hypothetical protein ROG8370_00399 [Roseovarius gaetbuli]
MMECKVELILCAGSNKAIVGFLADAQDVCTRLHGLENAGKTRLQDVRS